MKKQLLIALCAIIGLLGLRTTTYSQSAPAIEWQRSLGGTNDDDGNSIQQTSDGGFIVAGSSHSNNGDVSGNHGNYDYWIVKLGPTGTLV